MFMPARPNNKKLPPASKSKRLMHAFYLAQPFLQFFALMAVLFVLGRCSPLSPSTDRTKVRTFSDNGVKATEKGLSQAEEIDINNSLTDLTENQSILLLKQSEFDSLSAESVHADTPASDAHMKNVLRRRGTKGVNLLVLPLQPAEYSSFFSQGAVRVDLAQRMSRMDGQVRNDYFRELKRARRMNAVVYLVLPDAVLQKFSDDTQQKFGVINQVPLQARVQLGFPREDKSYVKLISHDQRRSEREAELIKSVLELRPSLAVVLE